jgi:uncharacterized protein (TIGR02271 family)
MSQTVVGIFEHASQAQEAKAYLIANGFNSQNIDINTIAGSNYGESTGSEEGSGIGDRISHFFSSLFDDENDAQSHSEAARRGTTVTVYTTTEDQTMQAVQVLDNFGAVDVNDFAQSARNTGGSTGTFGSTGAVDPTAAVGITGAVGTGTLSSTDALGSTGSTASTDANSMGYNSGADEPLDTDLVNTDMLDTDILASNTSGTETMNPAFDEDIDSGTGSKTGAIPIIEEDLQVGKQEIQTGGVRMRSRIVERPVSESIRLRSEHVNVERTPVDRPATDTDFAGFQEGTVEVTEHAEIPVVAKDARVVEEVNLNKEVTENEQTITDTVRRTEVDTENLNDKNKTNNI